MRRKIAFGTMGLLVLLAAAMLTWAEEGAPQGPDAAPGQHQEGGGPHPFGMGGPHGFADRGPGGFGQGRMGWQRGGGHGFEGGGGLLRMAENPRVREYLGLTDEQVGRLHKIGVETEKGSVQTRADMQLRHIELRELLRADNPDHEAIMQKLDEVNALRGKMAKQHVEALLTARTVLTPEQLKKVKTFMDNRGAGGENGRGGIMQHRYGQEHEPHHMGGPGNAPSGATPRPQEPPVQ